MPSVLQASLLDQDTECGLRALPTRMPRTILSNGAWVDVFPDWVSGAAELFSRLVTAVDWQAERRWMYDREVDVPRLVRFFGADEALPEPILARARAELSRHYAQELGEPFVTAGMCLYRNGRDSVAWHGDRIGRSRTRDTMVAIVSLGTPRPLLLRPRGGGPSLRFVIGHGDLLVMGGSCQRTWDHAVPKVAGSIGPRISVQFRPVGVR